MRPKINPGAQFFAGYRKNQYYYVDKTGFLEEFLPSAPEGVWLFTRPRRFGKTLTLSMMAEFFDITRKSSELFKGLAVSRNRELCQQWMNQYPVIFLTFKDIKNATWEECYESIRSLIATCLRTKHSVLLRSRKIIPETREFLKTLARGQADRADIEESLYILCSALYDHYGKNVILLIDEYDTPVHNALENGFYEKMIVFMRIFLSKALKGNEFLEFSVLTGCLRITRESIFTGLNNLKCYGVTDSSYSDVFGFTEAEVFTMLEAFGMGDKRDEVREWYDGYSFGKRDDIYCPWGITNYIYDHIKDPDAQPQAYWLNTSGNDITRSLFREHSSDLEKWIGDLLDYPYIVTKLQEQCTCNTIQTNLENFWSLMCLTGYLTRASCARVKELGLIPGPGQTVLAIPNKEVFAAWEDQVRQWFQPGLAKLGYSVFTDAFWAKDVQKFEAKLNQLMRESFSYMDCSDPCTTACLSVFSPVRLQQRPTGKAALGATTSPSAIQAKRGPQSLRYSGREANRNFQPWPKRRCDRLKKRNTIQNSRSSAAIRPSFTLEWPSAERPARFCCRLSTCPDAKRERQKKDSLPEGCHVCGCHVCGCHGKSQEFDTAGPL